MEKYLFFKEDLDTLNEKIIALNQKIKQLGVEQGEAAGQGTENMGHDDATQEYITYERNRVLIQLAQLQKIKNNAKLIQQKNSKSDIVKIGCILELEDSDLQKILTLKIGSYMVLTQHSEYQIISYKSPLAQELIGKKKGQKITFRKKKYTIRAIN